MVQDISGLAGKYDRVALVLQGGGALGAYQAGVYQALAEANCDPNWIAGVSIGAINSALIAGNPPEKRLAALETFWNTVSGRKVWLHTPEGDIFRDWRNQTSAMMAMIFGQPGFFKPRGTNPWLSVAGAESALSYYDTAELKRTLESLVDFDLLNNGKKRLSVGAVNVRTGNFIYFDTCKIFVGPEHIMASGAAPGFAGDKDRRRTLLGWRHRLQYAATASARRGALGVLAGVSGGSLQRARLGATPNGGCSRASERHHLFQPHPPEHRHLRACP